jgi:hypothetical protein
VTITAPSALVPTVKASALVSVMASPGATSFTIVPIGTALYLGGFGAFALQSTSANGFLVGTGTQGGGGGDFLNALLQMTNGTVQDITPSCCRKAGLPQAIALQSPTDGLVAFSGDVYSVHIPAKVFRLSGATLSELPVPPGLDVANGAGIRFLRSVGNNVYNGLGRNGVLYRYENSAWSTLGSLSVPNASFYSFVSWHRDSMVVSFCNSPSLPDAPTLVRVYNGTQTTAVGVPGTCGSLEGVLSDSLWGASWLGFAVWNGTAWRTINTGLTASDTLFHGTNCGATRYAMSTNGNVYSNTGSVVTRVARDGEAAALGELGGRFFQISCAADGTMRTASGYSLVSRRSGGTWVDENFASTTNAISLSSESNGYLVGDGVVYQWNGNAWRLIRRTVRDRQQYFQAYAKPSGGMLTIGTTGGNAGAQAFSLRYTNGVFTEMPVPGYDQFVSLAGVSDGVAYAVARSSVTFSTVVLKFENGHWMEVPAAGTNVVVVSASAPDNVMAFAANGTVMRFNGIVWTGVTTAGIVASASAALRPTFAMAGNCTGSTAQVMLFNGTTWANTLLQSTGSQCVVSLFGTSPTDMYALVRGFNGASTMKLHRWNGVAWSEVATPDITRAKSGSAVPGLTALSGFRGFSALGTLPAAAIRAAFRK